MFGRRHGANCDGHSYFPQMGVELRRVLTDRPEYLLGLQPLAVNLFKGKIQEWLEKHQLTDLAWIDADVFHKASGKGELEPLVEALRQSRLIVVGPPHLSQLGDGTIPRCCAAIVRSCGVSATCRARARPQPGPIFSKLAAILRGVPCHQQAQKRF